MESRVVSSAEMRAAEETAFARGITAEALMDRAAAGIARTVSTFFPNGGRCLVFAGKGNNAGDALAAAELLHAESWQIHLRLAFPEEDYGDLPRKKLRSLRAALQSPQQGRNADISAARPQVGALRQLPHSDTIVLDGLLGLGATPPLREPIRSACREVNRLRREENAFVFAVDLPTGLDGDSGDADEDCITADFTVTIGFAKRGLLADRALNFVGRIEIIDLPFVSPPREPGSTAVMATAASLRRLLPRREFGAYKNQFGRIGIVAGSKGLTGAAVLCALGALRAGGGLVEIFVPEEIYPIVAANAPAEAMVRPIATYEALLNEKIDVWALGPGLGRAAAAKILQLIKKAVQPMVIDADGLNILSHHMATLNDVAAPRLLTPHPGEMKRLIPDVNGSRAEIAMRFCQERPVTLLLKGSRTIVAEHGRSLSYNTTGNPGMATGGMGDVLTGVCAALIGQSLSTYDAARVGAWICGRAAEIAIFNGNASEESLLPTDVIRNLGLAFEDLRSAAS